MAFSPSLVISTMVLGPPTARNPLRTVMNFFSFRTERLRLRELFGTFTANINSVNAVRLIASNAAKMATRAELERGPDIESEESMWGCSPSPALALGGLFDSSFLPLSSSILGTRAHDKFLGSVVKRLQTREEQERRDQQERETRRIQKSGEGRKKSRRRKTN